MDVPVHRSGSIVIDRSPDELFELVSDITHMGAWSPVCKACWWDEGDAPRVGAMFTGRNELPERTWETRSEVVAANPGREFAWEVTATGTRWGYTFDAVEGGTEVTESWDFPPEAVAVFRERFGDGAEAQIAERSNLAETGIAATLAAIKATAEAS